MNSRRKVTLAILFVMTALLAGVSIFITLRIQQNNAANDANASGFGQTATRDLYDDVQTAFAAKPCERFFGKDFVNSSMNLTKDDIISVTGLTPTIATPKECTYNLSNNRTIKFRLVSYNLQSYIDPDEEALYARIGSIYQQDPIDTFLSFDTVVITAPSLDGKACDSLMYHVQNDFEYALVEFKGFGDCATVVANNKLIMQVFAGNIQGIIVSVTPKLPVSSATK